MGWARALIGIFGFAPSLAYGAIKALGQLTGLIPPDAEGVADAVAEQTELFKDFFNSLQEQQKVLQSLLESTRKWESFVGIFLQIPLVLLYGVSAAIHYIFKGLTHLIFFGSSVEEINIFSWQPLVSFSIIATAVYSLIFVFYSIRFFFNNNTKETVSRYKQLIFYSIHSFLMLFMLPAMILISILISNQLLETIGFDPDTNIATWIHKEFIHDIIGTNSLDSIIDTFEGHESEVSNLNFSPFPFYLMGERTTDFARARLIFVFFISLGFLYIFLKIFLTLFKNEIKIYYFLVISPLIAISFSTHGREKIIVLRNQLLKTLLFKVSFFLGLTVFHSFLNNYSSFYLSRNNTWVDESTNIFSNNSGSTERIINNIVNIGKVDFENVFQTNSSWSFQHFASKTAIVLGISFVLMEFKKYLEYFFDNKNFNFQLSRRLNTIFEKQETILTTRGEGIGEPPSPKIEHLFPSQVPTHEWMHFSNTSENQLLKKLHRHKYEHFRRNLPF